jgi:hypothetical protein
MKKIKKSGQAAGRWQFVVGWLRFRCISGWWWLLLALRVPAPARLRPGLWAPWQLPSWQFVRSAFGLVRAVAWLAFVALFPWLVALFVRFLF